MNIDDGKITITDTPLQQTVVYSDIYNLYENGCFGLLGLSMAIIFGL